MSGENGSWYEIVDKYQGLKQGDFIESCPIIIPEYTKKTDDMEGVIEEYDVVVLSQSCDIENKKLDFVLVCPVWTLNAWKNKYSHFEDDNLKENLRRGYLFGHCILNKCKLDAYEGPDDYFIVDFRNVFSIPLNKLLDIIKKQENRLRLIPPYREHLSQSFARFFMRVGLPSNIPSFV